MRFLNVIIFIVVSAVVIYQDVVVAARVNLTQVQEECFKVLKLNEDEKERIRSESVYEKEKKKAPLQLQCFAHCYYHKLGIIDDKNRINETIVANFLNQIFDDDEKHVKSVMKTCKLEKKKADKNDMCEMAYYHALCLHEHIAQGL